MKQEKTDIQVNPQNDKLAPPVSKRYTKQEITDVIWRTHGLTAAICSSLDCSYAQWQVYLKHRPDMKATQQEARQGIVDMAEKRLLENLNSKDDSTAQRAAEFILKHLGTSRGWSDLHPLQQINVDKDGTVTIQQIFGIGDNDGE